MKYYRILFFLSAFIVFGHISCKKDIPGKEPGDKEDEVCELTHDPIETQIRDSVFYYSKLFSLWEEHLPPRKLDDIDNKEIVQRYTMKYCTGEEVLQSLMDLTPLREGKPVDRYSFLDRTKEVSDEIQEGVARSFGMYVFYLATGASDGDADLYVRMVDKGSPAYDAGIRRGTHILSLNGNTNIGYNAQMQKDFKDINEALASNKMDVKFENPNSAAQEKSLDNTQFDLDPIIVDTVYTVSNKKIGYFAYNSFINVGSENNRNNYYTDMEVMFDRFESENISDLIIDLRYNGGGSVNTAEYLANRLAPASADSELMYSNKVNQYLEEFGWTEPGDIFAPVHFKKEGDLDLTKVYFIVSSGTASASELLINVLEPYMDVKLVGSYGPDEKGNTVPENTYGKPVGFFGYPIVDEDTELYVTSFQMMNKDGESDYFQGITPDHHSFEGFFKDFGDTEEDMTAAAINHIVSNDFEPVGLRKMASIAGRKSERKVMVKDFKGDPKNYNMYKFFTNTSKGK